MDARTIASRLTPTMFPGPYVEDADLLPDLGRALPEVVGADATVQVGPQDEGAIRPVQAFNQEWRPHGVVLLRGRRIGVAAALLRHEGTGDRITSAIGEAMVLALHYDEVLIVLVTASPVPELTLRERALLDQLWRSYRTAWTAVPSEASIPVDMR